MQMDRLDSLDFESLETCKSYHMGKMTESLVFNKMELESNLLEVIHFDVCSPMSAEACGGVGPNLNRGSDPKNREELDDGLPEL